MSETNLLLSKLNSCPQTSEEIHKYFSEVAKLLMNNYVISKRGINYEIIEIEFYFFSKKHQDIITYPRGLKAGEWFFHQSGVDLTFESNTEQFGGILIRGIKRMIPRDKGDSRPLLILGPQKCVDELWDAFNAFVFQYTNRNIVRNRSFFNFLFPLYCFHNIISTRNCV